MLQKVIASALAITGGGISLGTPVVCNAGGVEFTITLGGLGIALVAGYIFGRKR